jgi:hypothetical protein
MNTIEIERLQKIEKAAEDLFQACANLCLPDMDKLEKEIKALSEALEMRNENGNN